MFHDTTRLRMMSRPSLKDALQSFSAGSTKLGRVGVSQSFRDKKSPEFKFINFIKALLLQNLCIIPSLFRPTSSGRTKGSRREQRWEIRGASAGRDYVS